MQENPYCSTTVTYGLIKEGNLLFDITIESYDGAKVCELVVFYL